MGHKTASWVRLLAFLAAVAAEEAPKLVVNKCCWRDEVLDVPSRRCVRQKGLSTTAPEMERGASERLAPPFDEQWVRSWLPPGIPTGSIEAVWLKDEFLSNITRPVTASALWDEGQQMNDSFWRNTLVLEGSSVVRRKAPSGRIVRTNRYCIDATEDPVTPYALVLYSTCSPFEDIIIKCCGEREVLSKNHDGQWKCEEQKARMNHSQIPFLRFRRNTFRCPRSTVRVVEASPKHIENTDFCLNPVEHRYFSTVIVRCADSYIEGNQSKDVLLFCDKSRKTRGAYRLCRLMPFLTALLLAGALASIFRTERLRTTAHGWALASHGACLLGFNAGQILLFLTVTDDFIEGFIPLEYLDACKAFAAVLYFLQVAAGAWLSALCLNMLLGFRKLQVPRAGTGNERRRFRWLCAGAWGFPAAFTAASVATFATKAVSGYSQISRHGGKLLVVYYNGPSYMPSFAETRTCFNELSHFGDSFNTRKLGTLIFYFGPLCCLVVMNAVCLGLTARHVHFLRRGNSLLKRDREEGAGGQRQGATHTRKAAGGGVTEAQSVMVYIKLLLCAGLVEAVVEVATWSSTQISGTAPKGGDLRQDHTLVYRTSGYFSDLLRAMCVLWLAAPGLPERAAACWGRLVGGCGGNGGK